MTEGCCLSCMKYLLFVFNFIIWSVIDVGGLSLPIEHSFESGPDAVFHMRGSIHFRSPLKMGPGKIIQTIPLTSAEQTKLKTLAKEGGFYRVRVPTQVDVDDFSEAEDYVYTFTKACSLVESHLRDDITIHADRSGNVLCVMLRPVQGTCHGLPVASDALANFNSTVSLTLTVQGPEPDTQAYILKQEYEKQKKAKGARVDNWSYLLNIGCILFVILFHLPRLMQ